MWAFGHMDWCLPLAWGSQKTGSCQEQLRMSGDGKKGQQRKLPAFAEPGGLQCTCPPGSRGRCGRYVSVVSLWAARGGTGGAS